MGARTSWAYRSRIRIKSGRYKASNCKVSPKEVGGPFLELDAKVIEDRGGFQDIFSERLGESVGNRNCLATGPLVCPF